MSTESEILNLSKCWLAKEVIFDENLILKIYNEHILRFGFSHRQIQILEFTQYFERFLWPFFQINKLKCERQLIISICAIINEKITEKVNPWETIQSVKPENFAVFFQKVLEMILDFSIDKCDKKYWLEQIVLIQFLNNCFLSMTEFDLIFNEIKYLMSLGMWALLSERRLKEELSKNKEYKHKYSKLIKSDLKSESNIKFKRVFLPKLLDTFLIIVESDKVLEDILTLRYAENCILLFINLESMLVSRRYLNSIIDDKHVIVRAQKCTLLNHFEDTRLFIQLVDMLDLYAHFEIDEASGITLTDSQLECRHREKLVQLQREAFVKFKEPMHDIWLSTCRTLEDGETFRTILESQSVNDLNCLATTLGLIAETEIVVHTKQHLVDMFCYSFKKRTSTLIRLNNLPLYPTEKLIYDDNQIPEGHFSVEDNFAIPKLSVQYLSFHDYLMRNFELFRLEASYEIKQDIEHCLAMMKPIVNESNDVVFQGWSRMALAIDNFEIVEVGKPEIGRNFPKVVKADVTVILGTKDVVKTEWENLTKHDPCFLITVYPKLTYGQHYNNKESMASQLNNMIVRGCEIEGMLDKDGKLILEEDKRSKTHDFPGQARTWRVKLDPCQYHNDVINDDSDTKDVYGTFNIFLRRKPKENNFKAVLETIRDLMNDHCVVPNWLQELLLGYDQPSAAHYSAMTSAYIQKQNWVDTFLSLDHLENCFPQYEIKPSSRDIMPPFKLTFPPPMDDKSLVPIQMHNVNDVNIQHINRPILEVESQKQPLKLAQKFTDPLRWKIFQSLPRKPVIVPGNQIPFTATQVEAIRSGMQHGLTLVVGPPGTGKTDIAVQIISNIYRNYPNQRTLIVTHSNQALNQLFEKIMNLEIDERHLLRLGHGEEALETTKDFSKYGRVNYVLAKRLQLLREVEKLSASLGCINVESNESDQPLYTCETSQHFLLSEVMPRWFTFNSKYNDANVEYTEENNYNTFITNFPFLDFFIPKSFQNDSSICELFNGMSLKEDLDVAKTCFRHLLDMFIQLDDFRSFELMRNGLSRANSLLVQHAKIIAMTCTHAALRRRDLIQLGFTYDNILIEEAAQILEIETFIPLLLQKPDQSNLNRLKRWVMIGDHNQLPPVIKNMVFQNYCNMSQSMFARLVKLGVPAIQLNAQGRSRHDIVSLYSWRYKSLEDLPTIKNGREYAVANPGLLYDFQLINVSDYLGQGETEPTPHFIQNLAEAEYCVALYMYMRAIGYPPEKITILTTYNGQKHLIRDVIKNRCSDIGPPSKITTVDRFQGQQNDYVILSLVRTKTVGHLRDIRRLVVALSRARLGLYVFCRTAMFAQCKELQKSFGLLMEKRTDLALVTGEHYSFMDSFQKGHDIKVRMANEYPHQSSVSYIQDVRHMTQYVHTIYTSFKSTLSKNKRLLEQDQTTQEYNSVQKRQKLDDDVVVNETYTEKNYSEEQELPNEKESIIIEELQNTHEVMVTDVEDHENVVVEKVTVTNKPVNVQIDKNVIIEEMQDDTRVERNESEEQVLPNENKITIMEELQNTQEVMVTDEEGHENVVVEKITVTNEPVNVQIYENVIIEEIQDTQEIKGSEKELGDSVDLDISTNEHIYENIEKDNSLEIQSTEKK